MISFHVPPALTKGIIPRVHVRADTGSHECMDSRVEAILDFKKVYIVVHVLKETIVVVAKSC